MQYPSYLVHFNRRHDPKTGMFTYGDGDGDGIRNDHANARKQDRSGNNSDRTSGIGKSISNKTPSKGFSSNKSTTPWYDHVDPVTGKYDPKRTFTDDDKLSDPEWRRSETKFQVDRAINRSINNGTLTKGSSFLDQNKENWSDEQKLENTEAGHEMVRRNLGYTMADITEEDEEERRKKKKKITQTHWGDNYKTV